MSDTPFEPVDSESPEAAAPSAAPVETVVDDAAGLSFAAANALKDVPLDVVVELGRAIRTIGECEALKPGHVIELNKTQGEPLDIRINGRLVASGEVVTIDEENYGIRITEIFDQLV